MESKSFIYWLQGYFEISEPTTIGEKETDMIKKHLALVFKHEIDPSMGDQEHQEELNLIHSGKPVGLGRDDDKVVYRWSLQATAFILVIGGIVSLWLK